MNNFILFAICAAILYAISLSQTAGYQDGYDTEGLQRLLQEGDK